MNDERWPAKSISLKTFDNKIKDAVDLVRVIWKILYPDTNDASLVKDCLPEPPTPTSRECPRGVRITRRIWTIDEAPICIDQSGRLGNKSSVNIIFY